VADDLLLLAARIVDPDVPADLAAIDTASLERAADVLVRQKVPLITVAHRYGSAIGGTPIAGRVERDRAEYQRQRSEFGRVLEAFGAAAIPAMMFKSVGDYPSFHYTSSNLDVIVPDGRADHARKRLTGLEYVELLNVEEPKKCLFRRFPGDGTSHTLHLHEVVGWGVPFVDNGPLWQNARKPADDPGFLIPGPLEALLITLAHWFYEDKDLTLGNLLGTAHAVRSLDVPLSRGAEAAARFGWEEGFWAALEVADRSWRRLYGRPLLDEERRARVDDGLSRFPFVKKTVLDSVSYTGQIPAVEPFLKNKLVYYRKLLRDPSRDVSTRFKDVVSTVLWAVRWKLRIRSQRGRLISISGCDGSGKTLQVERLKDVFETCDIRVKVVWSRGASSRFMGAFIRLGKNISGSKDREGTGSPDGGGMSAPARSEAGKMESRRREMQNPLKRFLFSVLFALDLAWIYCVKTRWLLWTGNVVIADRYVYDGLVDYSLFSGLPVMPPPAALRVLRTLAPRPAVAAVLDVDPEEALRRKPEEGGTAHLRAARDAFRELAEWYDGVVFPPEWSPEAINRRLALLALAKFYDGYGTIVNWLLWSNPGQLNPRRRSRDGG
jgi:thymidylate kinase